MVWARSSSPSGHWSGNYVRADPTELPILAELLPQIETLVEIIGRLWDWAPSNHRCLHKRLARSRLDPIDAGRFPWEDAGDQDAKIVTG